MIKEYRKQTGVWNVVIPRESKTVQCKKKYSHMFPNGPFDVMGNVYLRPLTQILPYSISPPSINDQARIEVNVH